MPDLLKLRQAANGTERPVARTRILSARFTESEYAALESHAWSKGMTVGDWVHEALLQEAHGRGTGPMEMHIFAELVGLQMLLMSTLEPLLRGERIAQDQLAAIFRQVQTTKAAKAQELLAKRSQKQEK